MDAPLALQVVDHGVDRRRVEWVATDQQRMEREAAAQEFILHELRGVAVHAQVALHLDQIGRDLEHVAEVQEGLVGQLDEAFFENGLVVAMKRS